MKVLVLGVTGFIGFPAAQALVRAGHIVYGLTRNAAKSQLLRAEEIIPIVGEPTEPDRWLKITPLVDVIIDAIGGSDIKVLSNRILQDISQYVKANRDPTAPKVTFIYSSGTWVHGTDRKEIISDTTPLTNNVAAVSWRPAQEQLVINDPVLNGLVIRPALLYGRSASLFTFVFKTAHEGKVIAYGTPGGRWALIHADDLADLYVLAAEKGQVLGGKIFDAANDMTESVDDFLQKLVEVSGASGFEYRKPENLFHDALGTTALIRPYLARALVGWRPKKPSLVDGLAIYYAAWKASEGPE